MLHIKQYGSISSYHNNTHITSQSGIFKRQMIDPAPFTVMICPKFIDQLPIDINSLSTVTNVVIDGRSNSHSQHMYRGQIFLTSMDNLHCCQMQNPY